jgi:hypothetical protein
MTTTANITCPANDAAHALRTALVRYERMASPPRRLQFPILGDLAACQRAYEGHVAAGRTERARELGLAIDDELTRRARLEQWQGRSSAAWDAIVCRLWNARQDAVAAGVLVKGSNTYQAVSDRLVDAKREQLVAARRELRREDAGCLA